MADDDAPEVRVEVGPAPAGLDELVRLREELEATPGFAVRRDMGALQRTWNVFYLNWAELEAMTGRFKADTTFALDIWGTPDNRARWESFLLAMDRPLHNFIASAVTLIDHTRIVARRRLGEEALKVYQERVDAAFAEFPRSRFVTDLRNFMLHYTLPATGGTFSYEKGDALQHAIVVDTGSLLLWGGWKAGAQEFIESADDGIDLHAALGDYFGDVREFQGWFGTLVVRDNEEALADAQRIADAGNELAERLRPFLLSGE